MPMSERAQAYRDRQTAMVKKILLVGAGCVLVGSLCAVASIVAAVLLGSAK